MRFSPLVGTIWQYPSAVIDAGSHAKSRHYTFVALLK